MWEGYLPESLREPTLLEHPSPSPQDSGGGFSRANGKDSGLYTDVPCLFLRKLHSVFEAVESEKEAKHRTYGFNALALGL